MKLGVSSGGCLYPTIVVTPKSVPVFSATVPMKLPSRSNLEKHHWARAKLVKEQHARVGDALVGHEPPSLPLTVRLTRVSSRMLDDDNVSGACKAARDRIAEWLGVDDGDPLVTWLKPKQEKTRGPKYQALRIEIWHGLYVCPCCDEAAVPHVEVDCG